MQDFEKLASFYLGRVHDPETGQTSAEPLLYDAKDLTTHAVCVGMTGSGKTGLCVGLLEEAAIDGIPSIVIDPKGDMGNLMLTFPELRGEDFRPWVDPGEAARKGRTPDEHAGATAELWRKGLADWGQDGERIRRLRKAADVAIYTPGSSTGLPLSILKSFDVPPAAVLDDAEAFNDRLQSAVAGLLALVGVDADPVQSREFILLSNVLSHLWRAGQSASLADLIRAVQDPPFDRLGVLDLESFFPSKDRFALAMRINNLLASPGFAAWMEGEPLDVQRLLYTPEGRPRIAILSIAHLSDAERMFFVTLVLNEIVAWMRSQSGTSSLRAILYMDEIFGYFPPTKEPPSKRPMLLLLKQARAYGLGVVLATQNPVDLDYKGLSNTGTWFLGRLQTERDKLRVLDGLEGAMTTSGASFDRREIDRILSGLGKRVFLMNNVHENGPALFRTRWVLSYLRGPLTREHVRELMAPRRSEAESARASAAVPREKAAAAATAADREAVPERPVLPTGIQERFLEPEGRTPAEGHWLLRPALFFGTRVHHASRTARVDVWSGLQVLMALGPEDGTVDWDEATLIETDEEPDVAKDPPEDGRFGTLPPEACRKTTYRSWKADLKRWLYENRPLVLWKQKELKLVSEPGEAQDAFRARVSVAAQERRDLELEKLRKKYAPRVARAEEKIRRAEEKLGYEKEQVSAKKKDSMISTSVSILGALFGRKKASSSNVSRAGSALRARQRVAKEKADVQRAKRNLKAAKQALDDLETDVERVLSEQEDRWHPSELELVEVVVRPRKTDLTVNEPLLLWLPWRVDADGVAAPGWET